MDKIELKKISNYMYEVPKHGKMRVPAVIYADSETIKDLEIDISKEKQWNALLQLINVAMLPGIQRAAIAMADIHPGYGFPIGGVGAFDFENGVVSVAGVGFDCNCGVRMLRTQLSREEVEAKKETLANQLASNIPAGLGVPGHLRLSREEIDKVLVQGAAYAVKLGYGNKDDLEYTEERGCLEGADPAAVSDRAKERQFKQVGTLGSGNHYLEVQYVEELYDRDAATHFGLREGQVMVAIHCGSRALGHQIGTDYLKVLAQATRKYGIELPDQELVCAPLSSPEAKQYISAIACGVNCAFANRHVLGHLTRGVFEKVFGIAGETIKTFYDVGHNNAKIENHVVDGRQTRLLVHRKGATRAFGPGHRELPEKYRPAGQPVLVGGTMGTASYVLRGTEKGMEETFSSTVHGAGRRLSRHEAKRRWQAKEIIDQMKQEGILVRGASFGGLVEEAPGAYKDIDRIVNIVHEAGINIKVARLRPLICIKG
ncbi:MAG: RtcB family protein [Candidatus Omnitrophica bacterium]|nr:RtcB family protein [Candidatus Omnitrophota bacterium]